jgi:hypothetical protein
MRGRPRLLGAVLLAGLALAACGESDDGGTTGPTPADTAPAQTLTEMRRSGPLSPAGVAIIRRAQEEVAIYCRKVARGLTGGDAPTPRDLERVTAALDELAELASRQPEAQTDDGTTPRLALGDIAENLEGTNCDPRLVARIDEALAMLPTQ